MASANKGIAFLLYAQSSSGALTLREAFKQLGVPRAMVLPNAVFEQRKPLYVDVSGHPVASINGLRSLLEAAGYAVTIYVKEAALPRTITESWMQLQTTYGVLRQSMKDLRVVTLTKTMVKEATALLEAEAGKPKVPSEVDRLKLRQKQDQIQMKVRQNNDVLQAQQRELQKKSREDQQKLTAPKPAAKR